MKHSAARILVLEFIMDYLSCESLPDGNSSRLGALFDEMTLDQVADAFEVEHGIRPDLEDCETVNDFVDAVEELKEPA